MFATVSSKPDEDQVNLMERLFEYYYIFIRRMPLVLASFNCSGENIIFISEILAAKRKQLLTVTSILIHVLPLDFSRGYINCLIDEVVYLVENHKK